MDTLVTQAQRFRNLAQGPAFGVQLADQMVVVDARRLGLVLQVEELLAHLLGFLKRLFVQRHHSISPLFMSSNVLDIHTVVKRHRQCPISIKVPGTGRETRETRARSPT